MVHKSMILQKIKDGKYFVYIPRNIVEFLKWQKGDKIDIRIQQNLFDRKINVSKLILYNQRLIPKENSPLGEIGSRDKRWWSYLETLKFLPNKSKEWIIKNKEVFDQEYLNENKEILNNRGINIIKSKIDGKLKTSPKIELTDKFTKEVTINAIKNLSKRRSILKEEMKELSRQIKNLKRRKD